MYKYLKIKIYFPPSFSTLKSETQVRRLTKEEISKSSFQFQPCYF